MVLEETSMWMWEPGVSGSHLRVSSREVPGGSGGLVREALGQCGEGKGESPPRNERELHEMYLKCLGFKKEWIVITRLCNEKRKISKHSKKNKKLYEKGNTNNLCGIETQLLA